MSRHHIFCLGAIIMLNCAPAIKNLPPAEQAQLTTHVYSATPAQLWDAVLSVLENREYTVQNVNKDLGTFTTDYVYESNIIAEYRKRIGGRITPLTNNRVKLKLILILELKTHINTWERMNLTTDARKEYQRLFNDINAMLNY